MPFRRLTLSLLALSVAAACGGGDGNSLTDPPDPDPDPQPSTISISPSSATMQAFDDTATFSATVRDQNGSVVSGVVVSWSSTDPSKVTVSGDGEAVAQANGEAEIIAEAEGLSDRADVTVDQQADEVVVSPESETLTTGDEIQLSAEAEDANGHPVEGAAFSWSSSETAIATVDSTGLVTAQASGEVHISATLDGTDGIADLTVEAAGDGDGDDSPDTAPTVSSVSTEPIPEGGSVTIMGSEFAPDAAGNTVLVDGAEASVASASSTELEIDVPTYLCQPAREVFVSVETSAGSDSIGVDLLPDESPVALAAGEGGLATDPATFCFQFEEAGGTERYLIGVQSASRTVSSLTPIQVTSEAADGSAVSLQGVVPLANRENRRSGEREKPTAPEWLRDHRRAEARLRAKELELRKLGVYNLGDVNKFGKKADIPAVVSGVSVGDTVSMRVPDVNASNFCTSYTEIAAVVRAIGDQAILLADTANPSGGFTSADYQSFSDQIDDDIIETQVEYFGQPTDVDGNGRVVALFTQEVNRMNPNLGGFVIGGDLVPRSTCAASDEGEVFYGKAPDPNGEVGPSYSLETAHLQAPATMAHEITHIIQFGRRGQANAGSMDQWMIEAQAVLGEEAVGHSITGRSPGNNYGYNVVTSDDSNGIQWYVGAFNGLVSYFGFQSPAERVEEAPDACGWWREDSSPCMWRALWYDVGWSFLRWLSDHFGPSYPGGEAGLHRDLVVVDRDAWGGIEQVIGENFNTLQATWAVSLYLDDRVPGIGSVFTIPSWNLFDIEQNTVETAHLQPFQADFSDWIATGEIRASSAGYILLEGTERPATALRVTNTSDTRLPAGMQVFIVRLE